jgi:hypothetical protein
VVRAFPTKSQAVTPTPLSRDGSAKVTSDADQHGGALGIASGHREEAHKAYGL